MSLADVYQGLVAVDEDLEKQAAEQAVQELSGEFAADSDDTETVKVAAEYDAAGRLMARSFFDEMSKAAAEEEAAAADEEDEEGKDKKKEEGKDKKKEEGSEDGKKKLPPALAAALAEKKAAFKQEMLSNPEFAKQMFQRYGG